MPAGFDCTVLQVFCFVFFVAVYFLFWFLFDCVASCWVTRLFFSFLFVLCCFFCFVWFCFPPNPLPTPLFRHLLVAHSTVSDECHSCCHIEGLEAAPLPNPAHGFGRKHPPASLLHLGVRTRRVFGTFVPGQPTPGDAFWRCGSLSETERRWHPLQPPHHPQSRRCCATKHRPQPRTDASQPRTALPVREWSCYIVFVLVVFRWYPFLCFFFSLAVASGVVEVVMHLILFYGFAWFRSGNVECCIVLVVLIFPGLLTCWRLRLTSLPL